MPRNFFENIIFIVLKDYDIFALAVGEIVNCSNMMTFLKKKLNNMASDKACASGNDTVHKADFEILIFNTC